MKAICLWKFSCKEKPGKCKFNFMENKSNLLQRLEIFAFTFAKHSSLLVILDAVNAK